MLLSPRFLQLQTHKDTGITISVSTSCRIIARLNALLGLHVSNTQSTKDYSTKITQETTIDENRAKCKVFCSEAQ